MYRTAFLGAAALIGLAAQSSAAVITVSPGQSIQAAIDAAAAGDTVQIQAGVYAENLLVDASKSNLVLMGVASSQVIVDARPLAPAGSGPGLRIQAAGVQVSGITVRHARSTTTLSGHGIEISADGCTLDHVVVLRSQNDGVSATGADFQATDCKFAGNTRAASVTGAGARFTRCEASQCGDRGISVTGDGASFDYVAVRSVEDGEGIIIAGAAAKVTHCDVRLSALDGIKVTGADAVVERNNVTGTADKGIRVNGSNFAVRFNRVANVLKSGDGIRLQNATSGLVELNVVEDCSENGLEISGSSNVTIRRNSILRCATEKEPALLVNSSTVTVSNNTIVDAQGDAIRVTGDGNVIEQNQIRDALEDGIDVQSGAGNVVDQNEVVRCLAEGIENNGTATVCTDNRMSRCRIDYANSGTLATDVGNLYSSGGAAAAPVIDD